MQIANPSDLPRKSEAEQRAFFESVLERAIQAETKAGLSEQDLLVAGTLIRLAFAGEVLKRLLLPALAHLCVPRQEQPDVTFHVWESGASGVALPPCPCPSICFTDRGDIWTMLSRRVRSAFHWSEHSLSLLDLDGREGIFWVRSGNRLPYWTIASPLRTLFHWWMEENGAQLLHAAAIGTDRGGLLVTGKGGVGKSTTALTCLKAGFRYVADDYLIVTLNPEPVAHSLYSTAKVNPDAAWRFADYDPQLLDEVAQADQKAVMFLHPRHEQALASSLKLKAVLTPTFASGAATRFEPASALTIKAAAAFTTLSQLPHSGQATIDFIDRLVAALPGYILHLGSDVDRVPAALADLLLEMEDHPRTRTGHDTMEHRDTPLISVVIPVHNGAHFIADAVESLLAQAYPALEIIIVDDGSLDHLDEVVAALPVEVRLLKQNMSGPAAARNRGIRDASGDIIAFLDVDDLWPRDKLKASLEAFRLQPDLDVVTGHGQLLEYDDEARSWEYVGDAETNYPYYIGAALYRRQVFERIGLFDERLRFAEDSDWFVRAQEADVAIHRLDRITLLVRRHADNMTGGKTAAELTPLRLLKTLIDRKRAAAGSKTDPDAANDAKHHWPTSAAGE